MLTELEQRADTEARHAHRELVEKLEDPVAADAQAALDRLIREAEERGARQERELQRKWETGDE